MALVAYKYMPEEMSEVERVATFAARHHTLDYVTKVFRDQASSKNLNSVLITGPRGAGKTTLVLMLCHRIENDPVLHSAWLPVRFPEELPDITSLRDLFSEALHVLAENGVAEVREWYDKVEAERDDDQSLELATVGLREVASHQKRRLVFLVENLELVFDRGLNNQEEAHLRRLLMADPFFVIVGTAVRLFDEITDYDKAFFNFFNEVRLTRLDDDQVEELLTKRADYQKNRGFRHRYAVNRSSVRAISRLTGGNPRLVTMLYEVLSENRIGPVVEQLRQIIDELTPLLKDILEHLPPQQSRVLDALMRHGGTATPSKLADTARLSLNVVTTYLKRLRDAQLVEVHNGGKGRKAHYTVPDQLFCTWYQMRYLRPQRRRIEMIVEFLRVCFDEEERLTHLRDLLTEPDESSPERSLNSEYFAASLTATVHESIAKELAVKCWLDDGRMKEAAYALIDFNTGHEAPGDRRKYSAYAHAELGRWLEDHDGIPNAEAAYREAVRLDPASIDNKIALARFLSHHGHEPEAIRLLTNLIKEPHISERHLLTSLFIRGVANYQLGNAQEAIDDYFGVLELEDSQVQEVAQSLYNRAIAKGELGDTQGEIDDYSAVVELTAAPVQTIAQSLFNRGVAKRQLGDLEGAADDYSAVLELEGAPTEQIARSLLNRGLDKGANGDDRGAIEDFSAVQELEGCPVEQIAACLQHRAAAKQRLGDTHGAIEDLSAVLDLEECPTDHIARSLFFRGSSIGLLGDLQGAIDDASAALKLEGISNANIALILHLRATSKGFLGDDQGAIDDYSSLLKLEGLPIEQIASCLVDRGLAKCRLEDTQSAIDDYSAVLDLEGAPVERIAQSLCNRAIVRVQLRDAQGAINDLSEVLDLKGAPVLQIARSLLIRGITKSELGDAQGAIEDFSAVLELEGAPMDQIAQSLIARGATKGALGYAKGAIEDFSAVLQLEPVPHDKIVLSCIGRANAKAVLGDAQGAIEDFSTVLELDGVSAEDLAQGLIGRGITKGQGSDNLGAIDDFSAVIALQDAPVALIASSLVNRGISKTRLGDTQGAIDDYSALLKLESAPKKLIAEGFFNRGVARGYLGDPEGAIDDFSAVLELENLPPENIARSLINRGVTKSLLGDTQGAIDDFSAVLPLRGVQADQIAASFLNRGEARIEIGDAKGAIDDYSAVLELEDAPLQRIATSFLNRGIAKSRCGDAQGAIDDFSEVLQRASSHPELVAQSLIHRSIGRLNAQDRTLALQDLSSGLATEDLDDGNRASILSTVIPIWPTELHKEGLQNELSEIVRFLAQSKQRESRNNAAISSLLQIAKLNSKPVWLWFWNELERQLADDTEFLDLLRPVAESLEADDITTLERLPADHRVFAETLLQPFSET